MTTTNIRPVSSDRAVKHAMQRAVAMARSVRGRTSPNPPVGAVVLQDDRVVGEGATHPPGGPHAEVVALAAAGDGAAGGTLVVTLEPCNHSGRTPPCTDAIQRAGIARVVVGVQDSNPRLQGGGLEALERHGIGIEVGPLQNEAAELIAPYLTLATAGRPYVTAKWAMTLDGKIAGPMGGESITGPEARAEVHRLRDQIDAVIVGARTARIDDPQLTVRPSPADGRQPMRVVIDSAGSLFSEARLLHEHGATLIVTSRESSADRGRLERAGAEVVRVGIDADNRVDLAAALEVLGERGIAHALAEGGAQLFGALFTMNLVDEIAAFISPRVMGPGVAAVEVSSDAGNSLLWDLEEPCVRQLGPDVMICGRRPKGSAG